jgi:hypothetical protein
LPKTTNNTFSLSNSDKRNTNVSSRNLNHDRRNIILSNTAQCSDLYKQIDGTKGPCKHNEDLPGKACVPIVALHTDNYTAQMHISTTNEESAMISEMQNKKLNYLEVLNKCEETALTQKLEMMRRGAILKDNKTENKLGLSCAKLRSSLG